MFAHFAGGGFIPPAEPERLSLPRPQAGKVARESAPVGVSDRSLGASQPLHHAELVIGAATSAGCFGVVVSPRFTARGRQTRVIARSDSDETIQTTAQADWIASLTLAMTWRLPFSQSSPPGLTRWSMLMRSESHAAANLSKPASRMDCRVKPGNDERASRHPAWIAGSSPAMTI